MRRRYLIPWLAVIVLTVCTLLWVSTVFAAPLTFAIPRQPQFGTFVSGYLTFDPVGTYFAGPFDITVGAISDLLPAHEFTDLNTGVVVQSNTSFHALWVFDNPFGSSPHLFLFVGFDSCSSTSSLCIFEMTYYDSGCSDCPPLDRVQGAIIGSPLIPVAIDIKPGSKPAAINPGGRGVTPVAILSAPTFDATTVDPSTVLFGPSRAHARNGAGHIEDVNGDGLNDLVLQFPTQATGITCGDTAATLTGALFSGSSIRGSDSIVTVDCQKN